MSLECFNQHYVRHCADLMIVSFWSSKIFHIDLAESNGTESNCQILNILEAFIYRLASFIRS